MNWFDSHCHLIGYFNKGILEDILFRAEKSRVTRMVAIGTSSKDWTIYRDLADRYRGKIYYSAGLHPCYVDYDFEEEIKRLQIFLETQAGFVALGEIGLDYFHLPKQESEGARIKELQKIAFARQLEIARNYKLPIVVHSRNAFKDCIEIIEQSKVDWKKVLFHCFSEGVDEVVELNNLGGRASFTGILTYKKNDFLREAAKAQGMGKLILETDSPYLSPEPMRGKENEPSNLALIGEYTSGIFDVKKEDLALQSFLNTNQFYGV